MLHTNTTTFPFGSPVHLVDAPPSRHLPTPEEVAVRREQTELGIDAVLAESFPASDPPAWNLTMARPIPRDASPDGANGIRRATARGETDRRIPGVIDVSPPAGSERTRLDALVSVAGAVGVALLVPVAILVVGLPVVLAGRGLLEVIAWLFPALR